MKPLLLLLFLLPCSLLPAQRFFWGDSTVVETPDSLIVTGFARDSILCIYCDYELRNKPIAVDTAAWPPSSGYITYAPFVKYSVHKKTGRGTLAYYRRPLGSLYDNMESLNGWVLGEMTETRKRKPVGYYTELGYKSIVCSSVDSTDRFPRFVERVGYNKRKRFCMGKQFYLERGLSYDISWFDSIFEVEKYGMLCYLTPYMRKSERGKPIEWRRERTYLWRKTIFSRPAVTDLTEAELLQLPEPFSQFARAHASPNYWKRFERLDSVREVLAEEESVFKPPRCAKEFVLSDSLLLCFEDKSTEDFPCTYALWVIRKGGGYITYNPMKSYYFPLPNTCMSGNYDLSPNRRYFVLQCYNDYAPLFFLVIDLHERDLVDWIEPDEDVCGGYWNGQNEWIHQGKVLFKGE